MMIIAGGLTVSSGFARKPGVFLAGFPPGNSTIRVEISKVITALSFAFLSLKDFIFNRLIFSLDMKFLAEGSERQTEIEKMINDVEKNYGDAVRTMNVLKNEINQLEQVRAGSPAENDADTEELNSAIRKLDEFIDFWILSSTDAWNKYRLLEKEFTATQASNSVKLNKLKSLCKESEQLAKDLLCYSLSHLKTERSP